MTKFRPSTTVLGLLVAVGALTSACGGSPETKAAAAAQPTCAMKAASDSRPVVAVEVGSAPASGQSRDDTISTMLVAGFTMKANFVMGAADGSGTVIAAALEGQGNNTLFRESDRTCKETSLHKAFAGLGSAAPSRSADLFAGLRQMASHLSALNRKEVHVVLLSDMINRAAPLNMSDGEVLAKGVDAMMAMVDSNSLLPNCKGWTVYSVGPNATGDLAGDTVRREFWSTYFERCGGRLVLFDSALVQFPIGHAKPTITHAAGLTKIFVPADVLFAVGSSSLSPSADPAMAEVTAEARRSRATSIVVDGYTDDTGNPSYNRTLSEARARAVAERLVVLGIERTLIVVHGYGEDSPAVPNSNATNRARNRRVEITLTASPKP